jgi:hypothetical protein
VLILCGRSATLDFFENISSTHFFGLWKLEMRALDRIFKEIQVEALSIFGIKIYFKA